MRKFSQWRSCAPFWALWRTYIGARLLLSTSDGVWELQTRGKTAHLGEFGETAHESRKAVHWGGEGRLWPPPKKRWKIAEFFFSAIVLGGRFLYFGALSPKMVPCQVGCSPTICDRFRSAPWNPWSAWLYRPLPPRIWRVMELPCVHFGGYFLVMCWGQGSPQHSWWYWIQSLQFQRGGSRPQFCDTIVAIHPYSAIPSRGQRELRYPLPLPLFGCDRADLGGVIARYSARPEKWSAIWYSDSL